MALTTPGKKSVNLANFVTQMVIFGLLMVMVMFCANHQTNYSSKQVNREVDNAFDICKTIIMYFSIICGITVLIAIVIHFLVEPITEQQRYYKARRSNSVIQRLPDPDILMARKAAFSLNYRNCDELKETTCA